MKRKLKINLLIAATVFLNAVSFVLGMFAGF